VDGKLSHPKKLITVYKPGLLALNNQGLCQV
jgi:hypothetical protein